MFINPLCSIQTRKKNHKSASDACRMRSRKYIFKHLYWFHDICIEYTRDRDGGYGPKARREAKGSVYLAATLVNKIKQSFIFYQTVLPFGWSSPEFSVLFSRFPVSSSSLTSSLPLFLIPFCWAPIGWMSDVPNVLSMTMSIMCSGSFFSIFSLPAFL